MFVQDGPDPAEMRMVFIRNILPGDLGKQRGESSDAGTGGGARDIRFPQQPYFDLLLPWFPEELNARSHEARVHWKRASGETGSVVTRLWLPTTARKWEARIGPIGHVEPWVADPDEYDRDRDEEHVWIYLLSGDENARLWARLFSTKNLAAEPPWFRDVIRERIRSTDEEKGWYAFIDRTTGEVH